MMKATVEQLSKKEVKTKFGMKPTYSFKADGEWYQAGFTNPYVYVGDTISFEYTESKYGKEVAKGTIMVVGAGTVPVASRDPDPIPTTPAPKSTGNAARPFPIPPLHGDRAIIRQNALAHATRVVTAGTQAIAFIKPEVLEEQAGLIISLARKFEAYACGDLDVALAEKKVAMSTLMEELK